MGGYGVNVHETKSQSIQGQTQSYLSHAFWENLNALNSGGGCSNLGFMYKKGKGVKQDDFKAFKHKRRVV